MTRKIKDTTVEPTEEEQILDLIKPNPLIDRGAWRSMQVLQALKGHKHPYLTLHEALSEYIARHLPPGLVQRVGDYRG